MVTNFSKKLSIYIQGIVLTYSQIFFSNHYGLGILLMLVTFFDVAAGLSGLLGIITVQIVATMFGFNKLYIKDGFYTYNVLLVCLAIGVLFDFNLYVVVLVVIASILTFLFTIFFINLFSKYYLPILSIPFLIVVWAVHLGAGNFTSFHLDEKGWFSLYRWAPELFEYVSTQISTLYFADFLFLYLRSLGAIFFQYNDLAGLFIAIGLLFVSRITFFSSVLGFLLGFFFYRHLQGDFNHLIYSYIGFNFILTAIALNGFFIVANRKSLLLLFAVIPIIALLISSFYGLFHVFYLPIYSLPFNIVVLLILTTLQSRAASKGIYLVQYQQYSPEKNHYAYYNYLERYKANSHIDISLPFIGAWYVSQGQNGDITHKEAWQYALDFDVRNQKNKTYSGTGATHTDYYCYGLPITAPASGWVYAIVNEVEDNDIGEVNIEKNWGNTIIIQHNEYLYSALSHLKKDSFLCSVGSYVNQGDIIAYCGSSGRSPEPHLHFQVQTTPHVGAKTLQYPVSHYIVHEKNKDKLHFYDIPEEHQTVSNIVINPLLYRAFHFIPGKSMRWSYEYKGKKIEAKWNIETNALNQVYLYCEDTKSTAYFINKGSVFYFTHFNGDVRSLLYYFYLAAQKCILGYYKGISIKEKMLTQHHFHPLIHAIHDITAPLFHYLQVYYHSTFLDSAISTDSNIIIKSEVVSQMRNKKIRKKEFEIKIKNDGFDTLIITDGKKRIQAKYLLQ